MVDIEVPLAVIPVLNVLPNGVIYIVAMSVLDPEKLL